MLGERVAYLQVLDPGFFNGQIRTACVSVACDPSWAVLTACRESTLAPGLVPCTSAFVPTSSTFSTCLGRVRPRPSSRSLPTHNVTVVPLQVAET